MADNLPALVDTFANLYKTEEQKQAETQLEAPSLKDAIHPRGQIILDANFIMANFIVDHVDIVIDPSVWTTNVQKGRFVLGFGHDVRIVVDGKFYTPDDLANGRIPLPGLVCTVTR